MEAIAVGAIVSFGGCDASGRRVFSREHLVRFFEGKMFEFISDHLFFTKNRAEVGALRAVVYKSKASQ